MPDGTVPTSSGLGLQKRRSGVVIWLKSIRYQGTSLEALVRLALASSTCAVGL